ncbi:MAG: 1-acyl-sn-glycerol-3-phosphate acyltransferase [Burkholderiales bacterium]|nr:1-acyl-sn-glycerol-3-phosphate acyltransferase [Burkholderiales bacterium]
MKPERLPARTEFTPRGSAMARGLLRLLGWHLLFEGFPARQGVILVYPHTSNWDFPLGVLVKWAVGVQAHYWGKDSLFRVPLLGRWMRWIGGIPVDRSNRNGVVPATAAQLREAMAQGRDWWLAAAPEGTRSLASGWRSGAYQVAVQAQAPIALVAFDYPTRTVRVTDFVRPCGDVDADFAHFAEVFHDVRGLKPELASPIRLRP